MKSKYLFILSTLILVSLLSIVPIFAYTTDDCSATGGTISVVGNKCIHVFQTNGDFGITTPINASVLVVAGGGSGGDNSGTGTGGGGGAGGLIYETLYSINSNQSVTIGLGGAGETGTLGENGQNSTFGNLDAMGGGGGGIYGGEFIRDGGSGGGAGQSSEFFGAGFLTQGFNGGNSTGSFGGGGGGSAQAGTNAIDISGLAGFGGNGTLINITGTPTYYAGGGGAGSVAVTTALGGLGGGGNGVSNGESVLCTNGTDGLGGGGGAGQGLTGRSCWGGSGIVIVSYDIVENNEPVTVPFNVSLDSPSDNATVSPTNVVFDCDIEDATDILNLTLIVDGTNQYSVYNTTGNQTDLALSKSLNFTNNSTHNWTCQGFSNTWNNTATTRTFNTQIPIIPFNVLLHQPLDNATKNSTIVLFVCDISSAVDLLNLTLIVDGTNQYSVYNTTGNQTTLSLSTNLTFADNSTHNWACKGNSLTWTNTPSVRTFNIAVPIIPVTPPSVTSNAIYQLLNSSGAGLGYFIQVIAVPLFILLILVAIVGIVVVVGGSIAKTLKGKIIGK